MMFDLRPRMHVFSMERAVDQLIMQRGIKYFHLEPASFLLIAVYQEWKMHAECGNQ
jgi:hypothetical protein